MAEAVAFSTAAQTVVGKQQDYEDALSRKFRMMIQKQDFVFEYELPSFS